MTGKIIFLAIFILELGGVFSFYVSKDNQQPDIYEIREDLNTHTLTVINPKPEKPTLREIIYYHIIEKPYDQVKIQNNSLNNKNAGVTNKPSDSNNYLRKINKVEGFIEISGDKIKYKTGNTVVTNSVIKNSASEEKNFSVSENPQAFIKTNHDSNNPLNDKQTNDSAESVSRLNISEEKGHETKYYGLKDLKVGKYGNTTYVDLEAIKTKNVSSSLNSTLSENNLDSNFFGINMTSSLVTSLDGVEIIGNYSKLNDFHSKNQDLNQIRQSNKRFSESSAIVHKELELEHSIQNASLLQNNMSSKIEFENDTSYLTTAKSKTSRSNSEQKYIHDKIKESNITEYNSLNEEKYFIVKEEELGTRKVNNKSDFEQTAAVLYNKGSHTSIENITSEINPKVSSNNINIRNKTKYIQNSNNKINKKYENKSKIDYNNLNTVSFKKQTINETTEHNADDDAVMIFYETKTNNEVLSKEIANELSTTNHTHSDIIESIENNYSILNNETNKETILSETTSKNDTKISKIKSNTTNKDKDKNENILIMPDNHIELNINKHGNAAKIAELENDRGESYQRHESKESANEEAFNEQLVTKFSTDNVVSEKQDNKTIIIDIATYDKTTSVIETNKNNHINNMTVTKDINIHNENITKQEPVKENTKNKVGKSVTEVYTNSVTEHISNVYSDIIEKIENNNSILNNKINKERNLSEITSKNDTKISKIKSNTTYKEKDKKENILIMPDNDIELNINEKGNAARKENLENDNGESNQSNESKESTNQEVFKEQLVTKLTIDNNLSKNQVNKTKITDTNTNDKTTSVSESNKIKHVTNVTVSTDINIHNENITKQAHIKENSKSKVVKSVTEVYANSNTEHVSNAYHTVTNDNEPVIYVYSVYDNPYDGQEGVNFKGRQFTNGHGYQYFHPHPEDQTNVEQTNASENENIKNNENQLPSSEDSGLGTIVVVDNDDGGDDLEPTEDDKSKSNISKNKTIDVEKSRNRTKRAVRTLMSVHEDMAPEDMYKDVMDKISERVRRSLKQEGETYGMTLTGDRGVVWNNFNQKLRTYPVGEHSDDVEVIPNAYQKQLRTRTNEEKNKNNPQVAYSKKDIDVKDTSYNIRYVEELPTNKNYREYNSLMPAESNISSKSNHIESKTDSEENDIDKFNEIKINGDYNNDKYEEKSLEEFNIVKNSDEDYYGNNPQQYEPILSGNTYGMSLIGGRGNVWNDINGRELSYQVGTPTSGQVSKISEEDEIINAKIAAFQSFLRGAPSIREPKKKEPILSKTRTSSSARKDKIQNYLPDTYKEASERPTISINKQTNEQKSIEIPKVIISQKDTTSVIESKNEFAQQPDKLTGMSLSGNNGVVWNDLNGRRVSHHVGKEASSATISRNDGDDSKIDSMIAQFQKSLEAENSGSSDPITEKPVVIKPLTEEPIYSESDPNEPTTARPVVIGPSIDEDIITREPSTRQPPVVIEPTTPKPSREENTGTSYNEDPNNSIKTYGMSLTGDHGLVWNDLNGGRISYYVGESVEESKDNGSSQSTTSVPIESDKDEANQLINEIDQVLDEIDNILEDMNQEIETSEKEKYQKDLQELIEIIKEVFANESAKLDEKLNKLNDLNENMNSKYENSNSNHSASVQLVNNEEFRKWLTDWFASNTDHLMNQVDEHIKNEVEKQIEEYFTKNNETQYQIIDEQNVEQGDEELENENADEDISKKRKDCDNKKAKKESEIKITATNVYGSSVGNENVTNIFIFNVNKISELENNVMEPIINGTDGVHIFENKEEEPGKPVDSEDLNGSADKATTESPKESENENVTGTTPETVPEMNIYETSQNPSNNIDPEENNIEIIEDENKEDSEHHNDNKSKENTDASKEIIEPTSSEDNTDNDNSKEDGDTENDETNPNEITNEDNSENISSEADNVITASSEKSEESYSSDENQPAEISEANNEDELKEDAEIKNTGDDTSDISQDSEE